ncbi:MAG TPA: ABC transporter substrate-binding protein [Candidatus Udaeobacter sp.]|jgi:NitT/TauT family transport system substrate-binding protein|nr:ABC transporter substrate-binding protein [Candidatus Udaeobacter sp.]
MILLRRFLASLALLLALGPTQSAANPYLAKAGEAQLPIRIASCAISGGFMHLYTALDNRLFEKYGLKPEFLLVRGAGVSVAALTSNELQFLYCTADAIIPSLAAGAEAKMIASPLVGLPWVIIARKDIKRVEDLKGKVFIVTRPGGTPATLIRILMKKLHYTSEDLKIRHVGGAGQTDIYNALQQDIGQATMVTPPLDARAKRDGFNVIYHLDDLNLPAIYSSMFANDRTIKERPAVVQKFVAAMAEAIHFVEKNPDKAKASVAKVLALKDQESAQSAYDAYAKQLINRRITIPVARVAETIENARHAGANVRRKPAEIYDNSFAENLEKSGFMKELWGEAPGKKW